MSQTSRQLLDLFDKSLSEVRHDLADGTLDQSGHFYTDDEPKAQRVAAPTLKPAPQPKAPAA